MAERHLRDATRAYVDFVASILTPKPQSGKKAEKTEQKADPLQQAFLYPDLVRFLFWDQVCYRDEVALGADTYLASVASLSHVCF